MSRNGFPERPDSGTGGILHQRLPVLLQRRPHQLCPDGEGKLLRTGLIAGKIRQILSWLRPLRSFPPAAFFLSAGKAAPDIGHKKTFFRQGIYKALCDQLCIGIFHRDRAHAQIFRKTPLRGQFLIRPK